MKVTDEVYALDSTRGSYSYLIKGEENILIDTGQMWQGEAILKELQSMNVKAEEIKNILLTHHDLDHVGNAAMLQKLTKAKLWASSEDIPYIIGDKIRPGIKRLFSFIFRVKKPENIIPYNKDIKIKDIKVIATPGHTPGHVCVLYKDVLFVGDLVKVKDEKIGPYPNMNWDEIKLMESIKNIADVPFKWVCPAHGKPIKREDRWREIYSA